jgi:hypothetical protein
VGVIRKAMVILGIEDAIAYDLAGIVDTKRIG